MPNTKNALSYDPPIIFLLCSNRALQARHRIELFGSIYQPLGLDFAPILVQSEVLSTLTNLTRHQDKLRSPKGYSVCGSEPPLTLQR